MKILNLLISFAIRIGVIPYFRCDNQINEMFNSLHLIV